MRWRVVRLFGGTMIGVCLIIFIVVALVNKRPVQDLVLLVSVLAAFALIFAVLQKLDRPEKYLSEWILRDEGLERIRPSGEREIILWGQIRRMFWVAIGGLIVLYEEVPEPRRKPEQRLSRAALWIGQTEATEIVESWRKHCPRNEAERARRTVKRRRIGAGLMCLGVVIACVVGPLVYRAYQSYQWPSVEGKIVSMEYEFNHSSKYPMGDVQISYEYTVGGSNYQSERVRPLSKGYRAEAVRIKNFVNEHQKGMPVKVYYDPKQPAEAVLLQGPTWEIWGPLLPVGPLLLLLGWDVRRKELRLEF